MPDVCVPMPQASSILARDCMTTTNQEANRRPSLIAPMYHPEVGFFGATQTADIRKEVNKQFNHQ